MMWVLCCLIACPPNDPPRGPDLVVHDIRDLEGYGPVGGVKAFSFSVTVCNLGDQEALWFARTPEHPVISQNLFRLQEGRFEHIGMSWVKHGFVADQFDDCCTCQPAADRQHLGVGCSDTYRADQNGAQETLGPRSEINPHTGVFPYPFTGALRRGDAVFRRLQVAAADLPGPARDAALYFVELQYLSADDAAAGLQDNNATYRQVDIENRGDDWAASFEGMPPAQPERPAVFAWQAHDPAVQVNEIRVPADGLLLLGARATPAADGYWHYEYALQNLNAARAVGSLCVPVPEGAGVRAAGFHDLDHHSGEPYDDADWELVRCASSLCWETPPAGGELEPNALRWGTLYNFRFECDVAPAEGGLLLGLIDGQDPAAVAGPSVVPGGGEAPQAVCVMGGQPPDGVQQDAGATCGAGLLPALLLACTAIVWGPRRRGLLRRS